MQGRAHLLGFFCFFFLQMYSSFDHCPINCSSLGSAISLILLRAGGRWGWGAKQTPVIHNYKLGGCVGCGGRKALQRKLDRLD